MGKAAVSIKIENVKRIERLLERLEAEIREKALKAAVKAGATVLARAMRKKAPKPGYPGDKPGKKPLKDTIGTVSRGRGVKQYAVVGPQYPAGAHGHLVEFGTAGPRKPKRRSLMKFNMGGGDIFSQEVGPMPPHPFARPAFDESRREIQTAIAHSLVMAIRRAARGG